MTMDEIFESVIILAENDQSIPEANIILWTNSAIQRINTRLKSNIPTVTDVGDIVPAFDQRYHETLVNFCVSKYKEMDSAYGDAQYFMGQFDVMLMDMQRDMVLLPSTILDYNHQQITVTDSTNHVYPLLMPYGSYFDSVIVYLNNVPLNYNNYKTTIGNRTVFLKGVTLAVGDKITIKFENNSDLNEPPYAWWSF